MTPEQAQALLLHHRDPSVLEASDQLERGQSALKVRAVLEQKFSPSVCRALLECLDCRQRYAEKFDQVERWLLSTAAAQQATPSALARWRAEFLRERLEGPQELHEVGCGLGADSVFLSQQFPLISYEQDEARALLARANIEALGGAHPSEVLCQKVELAKLEVEVLFCDPARRQDRREFDPEKWSPPLSQLVALWETGKVRALGVKCAPGLKEQPEGGELHFLSLQGELKEAFLWFGPGSDAGQRTAWVLGERWERWTGSQGSPTVRAPRVGEFLHNPDPAILRARALDTLASQLNAAQLHSQIGYLSGPTPSVTRSATSFEIRHVQELNWKSLNQALAAQGWREFEYLGRGVPFSQLEVRKRLNRASKAMKKKGKGRGTVVIYRADHGYISLLCQRRECLQELE